MIKMIILWIILLVSIYREWHKIIIVMILIKVKRCLFWMLWMGTIMMLDNKKGCYKGTIWIKIMHRFHRLKSHLLFHHPLEVHMINQTKTTTTKLIITSKLITTRIIITIKITTRIIITSKITTNHHHNNNNPPNNHPANPTISPYWTHKETTTPSTTSAIPTPTPTSITYAVTLSPTKCNPTKTILTKY